MEKIRLISKYQCQNIMITHTHALFSGEHVITFWVNGVDKVSRSFKTEIDAIVAFKETCKQHIENNITDVIIPSKETRLIVTDAYVVANFFIEKSLKYNRKLNLKRLQQIMLVAYGLALKELNILLFREEFVVLSDTPSLNSICHLAVDYPDSYKHDGNILDICFVKPLENIDVSQSALTTEMLFLLDRVYWHFDNKNSNKLHGICYSVNKACLNGNFKNVAKTISPDFVQDFFMTVDI